MNNITRFAIIERLAELRSRISILKSSFNSFKQTIAAIQKDYMRKNQNPPLPYPKGTFENLQREIETLDEIIEGPIGIADVRETVRIVNKLDSLSNKLLNGLVYLQNLLDQRIASVGFPKLYETHPISQFEYSGLNKIYNAVDALAYELTEKILGSDWIQEKNYVPISLFGGGGYHVEPLTYLIVVPHADCFRMRFWAALGHEVAHLSVYKHLLDETSPVKDIIVAGSWALQDFYGILTALPQIIELTCDCIATYVIGPSAVLASTTILPHLPSEWPEYITQRDLRDYPQIIRHSTHPPPDIRLQAGVQILVEHGILKDDELKRIVDYLKIFLKEKKSALLTRQCVEYLDEYSDFAVRYAKELIRALSTVGFPKYKEEDWNTVTNVNQIEKLSTPIQLLNLAWYKRICTFKKHYDGDIRKFFYYKRAEPKIFENIVNKMYFYYINEVLSKVTRL